MDAVESVEAPVAKRHAWDRDDSPAESLNFLPERGPVAFLASAGEQKCHLIWVGERRQCPRRTGHEEVERSEEPLEVPYPRIGAADPEQLRERQREGPGGRCLGGEHGPEQ